MVLRGQDLWRRHPIFKWGIHDALPGLREGAAAFGVYMIAEFAWKKMNPSTDGHGHGHGHGHAEHGASSHGSAAATAHGSH